VTNEMALVVALVIVVFYLTGRWIVVASHTAANAKVLVLEKQHQDELGPEAIRPRTYEVYADCVMVYFVGEESHEVRGHARCMESSRPGWVVITDPSNKYVAGQGENVNLAGLKEIVQQ
jgi:hypothetical protein